MLSSSSEWAKAQRLPKSQSIEGRGVKSWSRYVSEASSVSHVSLTFLPIDLE